MLENSTNFPPQSYSSSFYVNNLAEDQKALVPNNAEARKTHLLGCFISRMKFLPLLPFFLHLASTQAPTNLTQCVLDKGHTRIFSNPVEYQGTKFSFDPRHASYQGNVVGFTSLGVEIIPKNFFVSFDSDHIVKLSLRGKGVTSVQDGAFLALFCLQELYLAKNNITNLSEGSFEGLQNLKKLDLSWNALVNIPDNGLTFMTLKSLKELDLSHNRIYILERLSFMTLDKLEILDLSFNKIHLVTRGVFDYLEALKVLYLNNNQLADISPETWKGLTSLEALNLAGNYLQTFDTSANFSFTSLRSLNLSTNSLSTFNVFGARKHLPSLSSLDLTRNSWYCEDLELIKHQLFDSKIFLARPVNCSEVKTTSLRTLPPSATPTPAPTTPVGTTKPPNDDRSAREVVRKVGEMGLQTRLLEQRLDHVESMLVYLFVLVAIVFIGLLALRVGVCRSLYSRLTGASRREGYLDNDETVLLTRR